MTINTNYWGMGLKPILYVKSHVASNSMKNYNTDMFICQDIFLVTHTGFEPMLTA